jgi:ribosome assembly protein 4
MATKLPPPKRQKSNYSKSLLPPEVPAPAVPVPSIVVQFKNAETGANLGPAVNLPADTARDALQMLVNKLKGEVSEWCWICGSCGRCGSCGSYRVVRALKTVRAARPR